MQEIICPVGKHLALSHQDSSSGEVFFSQKYTFIFRLVQFRWSFSNIAQNIRPWCFDWSLQSRFHWHTIWIFLLPRGIHSKGLCLTHSCFNVTRCCVNVIQIPHLMMWFASHSPWEYQPTTFVILIIVSCWFSVRLRHARKIKSHKQRGGGGESCQNLVVHSAGVYLAITNI